MVADRVKLIQDAKQFLSPEQVALKEVFIHEYMLDYDAYGAGIRSGMVDKQAKAHAKSFLSDRYINLRISEEKQRDINEDGRKVAMRQIDATLNELSSNPRVGAMPRIMAAKARAELLGLNAPTKTQADIRIRAAVMVVPGISSVKDWEKTAIDSQEKLVIDARSPA